jgi:hypothetical protein
MTYTTTQPFARSLIIRQYCAIDTSNGAITSRWTRGGIGRSGAVGRGVGNTV